MLQMLWLQPLRLHRHQSYALRVPSVLRKPGSAWDRHSSVRFPLPPAPFASENRGGAPDGSRKHPVGNARVAASPTVSAQNTASSRLPENKRPPTQRGSRFNLTPRRTNPTRSVSSISQVHLAAPLAGRVRQTAYCKHGGQASRLNGADKVLAMKQRPNCAQCHAGCADILSSANQRPTITTTANVNAFFSHDACFSVYAAFPV